MAVLDEARAVAAPDFSEAPPTTIADITADVTRMREAADLYSGWADRLSVQLAELGNIAIIDPARGEFDMTIKDGYTYHVEYSMNAKFEVDTTEGKPGQVALYLDLSGCSVTVTNTTPGKKAPGIYLDAAPLYAVSVFPELELVSFGPFATFGYLASPMAIATSTRRDVLEARTGVAFLDPFDNDGEMSSYFSFLGSVGNADITAGVVTQPYGGYHIDGGAEFEVGETRTLELGFAEGASRSLTSSQYTRRQVGEITEGMTDRFSDISGWALTPVLASLDQEVSFVGARNISSDLGDSLFAYAYDPAAN
jgi:hypothetical protein